MALFNLLYTAPKQQNNAMAVQFSFKDPNQNKCKSSPINQYLYHFLSLPLSLLPSFFSSPSLSLNLFPLPSPQDKVSLCKPGWPGIHYVYQAVLVLKEICLGFVLRLKVDTTRPSPFLIFNPLISLFLSTGLPTMFLQVT